MKQKCTLSEKIIAVLLAVLLLPFLPGNMQKAAAAEADTGERVYTALYDFGDESEEQKVPSNIKSLKSEDSLLVTPFCSDSGNALKLTAVAETESGFSGFGIFEKNGRLVGSGVEFYIASSEVDLHGTVAFRSVKNGNTVWFKTVCESGKPYGKFNDNGGNGGFRCKIAYSELIRVSDWQNDCVTGGIAPTSDEISGFDCMTVAFRSENHERFYCFDSLMVLDSPRNEETPEILFDFESGVPESLSFGEDTDGEIITENGNSLLEITGTVTHTDHFLAAVFSLGGGCSFYGKGISFDLDTDAEWGTVAFHTSDGKWFKMNDDPFNTGNPSSWLNPKGSEKNKTVLYSEMVQAPDGYKKKSAGSAPTAGDIAKIDRLVIGVFVWNDWEAENYLLKLDNIMLIPAENDAMLADFEHETLPAEITSTENCSVSLSDAFSESGKSLKISADANNSGTGRLVGASLKYYTGVFKGNGIRFWMREPASNSWSWTNTWGAVAFHASYPDGSEKWFKTARCEYGNPAYVIHYGTEGERSSFEVKIGFDELTEVSNWQTEISSGQVKPTENDIACFDTVCIAVYIWNGWCETETYIDNLSVTDFNNVFDRSLYTFGAAKSPPEGVSAETQHEKLALTSENAQSGCCLQMTVADTGETRFAGIGFDINKYNSGDGVSFFMKSCRADVWGTVALRARYTDGTIRWFKTECFNTVNPSTLLQVGATDGFEVNVSYNDLYLTDDWQTGFTYIYNTRPNVDDIAYFDRLVIGFYQWKGYGSDSYVWIDSVRTYKNLRQPDYVVGDLNADRTLDIRDLIIYKKCFAGLNELPETGHGDVNGDNFVNSADLSFLKKYLLGCGTVEKCRTYGSQSVEEEKYYADFLSGKTTVNNLYNEVFYAATIDYSDYKGGKIVRENEFVRGIASGFWHETEGWNLSDETRKQDEKNLKELGITSIRDYTGGLNTQSGYDYYRLRGRTLSDTFGLDTGTGVLSNGKSGGHLWIDSSVIQSCTAKITANLSSISDTRGMEIMLLGNEEQWMAQYIDDNGNWTGQYYSAGYDTQTLSAFRTKWLKERFVTVFAMNVALGTSFESFETVDPDENQKTKTEFWLFKRNVFENFYRELYQSGKAANPNAALGLAKYIGRTPDSDDAYLSFMDAGCQNLYAECRGDMFWYTAKMAQLRGSVGNKRCYNSESGFIQSSNGSLTKASLGRAARLFTQEIALTYMEPQMQGIYAYNYSGQENLSINFSYGLTSPAREKRPSYFAVKQIYNDIGRLENVLAGASASVQVGITSRLLDELSGTGTNDAESILHPLVSMGVGTTVVALDNSAAKETFNANRFILNDVVLYENPDGSDSAGAYLEKYLSNGNNRMITFNRTVPRNYYGKISAFSAGSLSELSDKYPNFSYNTTEKSNYSAMWNVLAPFVHAEFVNGLTAVSPKTIDENAVRIIDMHTTADDSRRWDIQQRLLYKDGHVYLAIVNCSGNTIPQVAVILGINNGVLLNLQPLMLCCDGGVSVCKPFKSLTPTWSENTKIQCGTVLINHLNTYAFIDLGLACVK